MSVPRGRGAHTYVSIYYITLNQIKQLILAVAICQEEVHTLLCIVILILTQLNINYTQQSMDILKDK